MIHYRISATKDNHLTEKVYRSFKSVLKDNKKINGSIYAYACYHDARTEQTESRLCIRTDIAGFYLERPKLLTNENIIQFVDNITHAKSINPHRCNSTRRKWCRDLYDGISIFGFDKEGRAISARIHFDISCNWNRTTSPIFINNQKSNKRGLLKYID